MKAESDLNSAILLDPTDEAAQTLLSHLRGLLKAQNLVQQLSSGVGGDNRATTVKEIRDIINRTNETTALSVLWQDVVKHFGEYNSFVIPQGVVRVIFALLVLAGLTGGISAAYDWFWGIIGAVVLFGVALVLYMLTIFSGVFRR